MSESKNNFRKLIGLHWRKVITICFFVTLFSLSLLLAKDSFIATEITLYSAFTFLLFSFTTILIISFLLWKILSYYLKPANFDNKKDLLDLFIKIIGGTTLLISLFTTWKSIKDTQYQLAQNKVELENSSNLSRQTMEATRISLDSSRKQQIEDRYYRAIEKLESKDTGVRTGAIYALGKIAEESDSHYWMILQILTGYVREKHRILQSGPVRPPFPCPPDLQAVFNIIGKRKNKWKGSESADGEPQRLDFSNTDLRGLMMRDDEKGGEIHFEGIRFWGADLEAARLLGVFLDDAGFDGANLRNTDFSRSSLKSTDFREAIFDERTNFMGTEKTVSANNLSMAKNYQKAKMPPAIKEELEKNEEE